MKPLMKGLFFVAILSSIPVYAQCDDDDCVDESIQSYFCTSSLYTGEGSCYNSADETGSYTLWGQISAVCGEDAPLGSIYAYDDVGIYNCTHVWDLSAYSSWGDYNTYNGLEELVYLGWVQTQVSAVDTNPSPYPEWSDYYYIDCEGNTSSNAPNWQLPC